MKQALYLLFSNYGPILELTLLKTAKLRGQAFVVYAHLSSAVSAVEEMHQSQLFGKNIVCG
jgi:RNA recognition motif-containing protein